MSDERLFFPWEWSRLPTRTDNVTTEICGIPVKVDPTMPPGEAELRGKYGRVRIVNIGVKP